MIGIITFIYVLAITVFWFIAYPDAMKECVTLKDKVGIVLYFFWLICGIGGLVFGILSYSLSST